MFIQTENTPNPNSLKFLPGRKVSNNGPLEILNQEDTNNLLIKNLLQINGVTGIFLGEDFFSINKEENKNWEDIQHIVISYVNEHYANGNTCIIDKTNEEDQFKNYSEIEKLCLRAECLFHVQHGMKKKNLTFYNLIGKYHQ